MSKRKEQEAELRDMNERSRAQAEADYVEGRLIGFVVYDLFINKGRDDVIELLAALPDDNPSSADWRLDRIREQAQGPLVEGVGWVNVGILLRRRPPGANPFLGLAKSLPAGVHSVEVRVALQPDDGIMVAYEFAVDGDREAEFHSQFLASQEYEIQEHHASHGKSYTSYSLRDQPLAADPLIGAATDWLRTNVAGEVLGHARKVRPPIVLLAAIGSKTKPFLLQRPSDMARFLTGQSVPSVWWTGIGPLAPLNSRLASDGGPEQGFIVLRSRADVTDGNGAIQPLKGLDRADLWVFNPLMRLFYPFLMLSHYLEQVLPESAGAVRDNRLKFRNLFTASGHLKWTKLDEAQKLYTHGAALRRALREQRQRFDEFHQRLQKILDPRRLEEWRAIEHVGEDRTFQKAITEHCELMRQRTSASLDRLASELEEDNRLAETSFQATLAGSNWTLQILLGLVAVLALVATFLKG